MIFYKWQENVLSIASNEWIKEITYPELTRTKPIFNKKKTYFAVGSETHLYIYDLLSDKMITYTYNYKAETNYINVCFDSKDRVYFWDKNAIMRWDFKNEKIETIYTMTRFIHPPCDFSLSPNEKLLAFRRYKSSAYYMYVLNLETLEYSELKFAVYHYFWIDNSHIAWSLSGGIKSFDLNTRKNKALIKDFKTVYKKCNKIDKEKLEYFMTAPNTESCIDLLDIKEDKLIFSLYVFQLLDECYYQQKHIGLWSVNFDGANPSFISSYPVEFINGIFCCYLKNGIFYNRDDNNAKICDGVKTIKFDNKWWPVGCTL